MNIFTKRNALVGYVALKAASKVRGRRKHRRNAWKLPLLVVLGLVSLGVLAGIAAAVMHRQRESGQLEEHAETAEEVQPAAEAPEFPEPAPTA